MQPIIVLLLSLLGVNFSNPLPPQPQLEPHAQNIYLRMHVQGPGSATLDGLGYELWFQIGDSRYHQTGVTQDNGYIYIPNAPAGTGMYWYVKGQSWLAMAPIYWSELCGDNCTNILSDPDTDLAGDAAGSTYGDNIVNFNDFNAVKHSFGFGCGGADYNHRADFTNDCVVNVQDSSLLTQNYGLAGYACAEFFCTLNGKADLPYIKARDMKQAEDGLWHATAVPLGR